MIYKVTPHEIDLQPTGADCDEDFPLCRLSGQLEIGPFRLHVEAYQVEDCPSGNGFRAASVIFREEVEAIYALYPEALQPQEINGLEYFLVAFPFAE